jgi:hypothetical protein
MFRLLVLWVAVLSGALIVGCASHKSEDRLLEERPTAGTTFLGSLAEGFCTSVSGENDRLYQDRTAMDQFERNHYAR